MSDSRTLALFPDWARPQAPARPAHRGGPPIQRRGDRTFRTLATRQLLNRCGNPRLPFAWTINPYRGCEFGCGFCYARATHEYLGYGRDATFEAFETEIWAKAGADVGLSPELLARAREVGPIAVGTATDPYQGLEQDLRLTRAILERLARVEGLDVSITTRSPLVLRDVDLLAVLAKRGRVRVNVSLNSLDSALVRSLEPRAPSPQRRLETIRLLGRAGIPVAVFLMPVIPLVTDDEGDLRNLLLASREAGARIVASQVLFVPRATWQPTWKRLLGAVPSRREQLSALASDPERFRRLRDAVAARLVRLLHELEFDREEVAPPSPQAGLWEEGGGLSPRPRRVGPTPRFGP